MNCLAYIKKPEDLVTSYSETRAGFIAIALEKEAFKKNNHTLYLFFIGAAIEHKMATELFDNLKSKYINNVANLTNPEHITALSDWLIDI